MNMKVEYSIVLNESDFDTISKFAHLLAILANECPDNAPFQSNISETAEALSYLTDYMHIDLQNGECSPDTVTDMLIETLASCDSSDEHDCDDCDDCHGADCPECSYEEHDENEHYAGMPMSKEEFENFLKSILGNHH